MDDATVQILLKAKQEGLDAIKDIRDQLADLARQARITNEQLAFIGAAGFTSSLALNALADAATRSTPATQAAATAAQAGQFSFLGMSGAALALVGAIAAAVIVLGPFIALVAGAVVITAAFAAGVAAVVGVLGLAFVPLAALAAGIIVLAERTNQGQVAMGQLTTALSAMADQLGAKALPMAQQMAAWALAMIPLVQQLGNQLLDWFGPRLPAILQIATGTANALFAAFQAAGPAIGKFLDAAIAMAPQLIPMFQAILVVGVQAVSGLATNLLALSEWFLQRLPAMAPIVAATMAVIGTVIQGVATAAGKVVDWFLQNWPLITRIAEETWKAFVQGWQFAQPALAASISGFQTLAPVIEFIRNNARELLPIWVALGAVAVAVAISFVGAAAVLVLVGAAIVGLFTLGDKLVNWLKVEVPVAVRAAGDAFSSLGSFVQGALAAIGGFIGGAVAAIGSFFSSVGSFVQGVLAAIGTFVGGALGAIGAFFSWLGTAVNAVWTEFASRPLFWIGFLLTAIPIELAKLLAHFVGWIADHLGRLTQWALQMAAKGLEAAVNFGRLVIEELTRLPGQIWDLLTRIITSVVSWGDQTASKAQDGAQKLGRAFMDELSRLPGQVWNLLTQVIGAVVSWGEQLAARALDAAQKLGRAVMDEVNKLPGQMWDLGVRAVQSLINGIGSMTSGVRNAVGSLFQGMGAGIQATIPGFAAGGTVPGPVGAPTLAMVHGGERVIPVGGAGTDMQDTNELLAAIHARLSSIDAKLGGGMSTAAYTARA
jgi:hypothetical protein